VDTSPYVWTATCQVDTGQDRSGRSNLSAPLLSTQLNLELTGLNPWQTGDQRQLFVANTDTWQTYDGSDGSVAAGATAISRTIDWTDPLIDNIQGDQVYITQLVTRPQRSKALLFKVWPKRSVPFP
jgi:hypothetical protein